MLEYHTKVHETSILKSQFEDQREEKLKRKLDLYSWWMTNFLPHTILFCKKLSDSINSEAWKETELLQMKRKLNEWRKCRVFAKVACAFMAIREDPTFANVSASII